MTAGGGAALAQTPVSFREAMTMVEANNGRWRAADVSVTRAEDLRAEQRGLYWPSERGDVLPCDGGLIGVAPRAVP